MLSGAVTVSDLPLKENLTAFISMRFDFMLLFALLLCFHCCVGFPERKKANDAKRWVSWTA
jgi:hypothetical protein